MDLAVKGRGSHALTLLQGPRVCTVALQLPKPFAHQQEQKKAWEAPSPILQPARKPPLTWISALPDLPLALSSFRVPCLAFLPG